MYVRLFVHRPNGCISRLRQTETNKKGKRFDKAKLIMAIQIISHFHKCFFFKKLLVKLIIGEKGKFLTKDEVGQEALSFGTFLLTIGA